MASPLYIFVGDRADVGASYEALGTGSGNTQPHQPQILDDREYDFGARIEGVESNERFPDAPLSDSYAPYVWNHDDIHEGANSIVSISAASTAVITGSLPHGRTAGQTVEIFVEGVAGADAAQINGTWTGTASGTHAFSIPLDTTSLTLTPIGATLRQAGWSYYTPAITDAGKPITCDTDRSVGGSVGTDSTANRRWGAELALLADLHDRWGEDAERPYFLAVSHEAGLVARESVSVSGVAAATTAQITVASSSLLADTLVDQQAVLWGFSGDHAALNGLQTVRYIDATTIEVDGVDTSAAEAYGGGGRIAMRPRWHPTLGAEAYSDLTSRLAEAFAAAADAGVTLSCKGIVLGLGHQEQDTDFANDDGETRTGIPIGEIGKTGFPTTITTTRSHGLAASDAFHLAAVRLRNCGDLDGLHEARVTDGDELVVHVENSATIDTTNAQLDIADPSWTFAEELPGFVSTLRTAVAAVTSDTATEIPVLPVQPRVVSGCGAAWDGTTAFSTCAAHRRIETAIGSVHAPRSGVSVIQTTDLRNGAGDSRELTRGAALTLGHRVASELVRQESRTTAYGSSTGRGAPVYFIGGDDYAQGSVSYLSAFYDSDQAHDGTQVFGQGIKVWDESAGEFQDYAPVDRVTGSAQPGNSNTHPTWNLNPGNLEGGPGSLVGPDVSLNPALRARHSDPIYIVKLGVTGSALTDAARVLSVVGTTPVETEDEDPPAVDLTTSVAHGRYDYTTSVQVTVSGLSTVGVPDGTYAATPQSPNVLRIELASAAGGGVPATGAGAVSVPRPDWRKASADIWPAMTAMRDAAFAAIRELDREPDVRGVFLPGLGLNDALYGETGDYQAALVQLFADLRDEWTTRSAPTPALPIVLGKLRTSGEYAGGTATTVDVSAIQTAQSAVCAADAAAELADADAVPFNSDDQTLTFAGYVQLGQLLDAAFDAVDQSCSAVEGQHTSTIPSSNYVT